MRFYCSSALFLLCSLFIALFALFLAPWFPLYEKRQGMMPWRVAPQVRLELTTLRLTAECSAIELLRNIFSFSLPLCYSLMFESGKNFRSSRSPLDPGNFLLSQAVPSSVPSAFGGLTSVFGMGTGGALQLSSPETFLGALSLASRPLRFALFAFAPRPLRLARSPSPHLQNCTGQS